MTKCCSICKKEKETSAFSFDKRAKDGLQSACKECRKIKYRKIRQCNSCLELLPYNNRTGLCFSCYQKEYSEKKKEKRRAYKIELSNLTCSSCGEDHPDCLEVHHLFKGAKRFNSRGQSSEYNIDDVNRGTAIVLCANCHSLFHSHFGGKFAYFPDQTKESTVEIIKLQRKLKGVLKSQSST